MPEILNEARLQNVAVTDEALAAMSAQSFLRYLRSLEVELRAKEGKLALNAPAGVVTPRLQEMIRSRKAELLEELEAQSAIEERVAPLTYAQERLWLIDRFSPETAAYNIPQAWPVDGVVDEAILRKALQELAKRHAALRTRIELRQGEPSQVVLREVEIPLTVLDLREMDEAKEEEIVKGHLVSAGSEPFALDQAPLIRFHLMHLPRQRSLIAYDVHHIVADQRSVDVMRRDLIALYMEAWHGTAQSLPMLTVSYADVAEREHSAAVAKMHAEQLAYWRDRLSGMPMLLELPFSRSSSDAQSYAGSTLRMAMDEALTSAVRAVAARSKTTLYMIMLSAFAVLLKRYTGQNDLCIGTPLTGRKRREEEELIGLFINMLPLRCRVDDSTSFTETVQAISKQVLQDFEHGDVPFQKLVKELHPHRSMTHSPLFQVMFALTPKHSGGDDAMEETFLSISKFDLTLQVAERAQSMDLYLEYRTDLFLEADIEQLGRHYIALLKEIAKTPESVVQSLPWITAEDTALFAQWNDTGVEFDRSVTLADLFAAQANSTPETVALRWKDQVLSYRELNERAERLASALHAHGVGPEQFVGVCLNRTPALIVTLLAIHKSGAAYLPLDPKYPVERLKYMLEDSGARLLVAERGELSDALAAHCMHVLVLTPEEAAATGEASRQAERAKPENAAYLIYTSGSTGKPKGVVVEHRNAVALIAWAKSYLDEDAYSGMLASTSVCFDLSVFEIFLPLATGKTIVLMEDVLALATSSIAEDVTLVNTVPSAMNALLQAGLPKSVTMVCLAGEFLPTELVDRIYAAGVEKVIDLYGPTETTTYSTCVLREPGAPATLGGPLGNTQIYLLNEQMQLVPPGVPGEIYIGGEGVTRGYLGRPELTAERFVHLPQIEPRGRLYRTGDLARRRHDGALLFMGRRDNQVKLRGHRIELGEVEAALREVSGVTEVAVVVRESGETLAAYVESNSATAATARAWGEKLREQLPGYMIPASIVSMPELPRTPNGKIDRQALRRETQSGMKDAEEDEAPQDLLEQWLANIWAQRLGIAKVTRNAHFFENLGGHSLAAFEIFAEMEVRLGKAMMLATLFQSPTVARLAAMMRRQGWEEPKQLRMLEPWTSSITLDRVIYCMDKEDQHAAMSGRKDGERLMAIDDSGNEAELARLICDYEATRPAIELYGGVQQEARLKALRDALLRSGIASVSLRIVK